ncbi:MAG: type II secretion system protein [Phycisphaerales bacterium]|nr:type II secretion system protein [Phycisphaerales bacterium]
MTPLHSPFLKQQNAAASRKKFLHSRRGATLIEAVLATVLLGMVAATLASAVSFMSASQRRMEQRLGAAELANRLMLMYMDDQDAMPNKSLPIEYDIDLYRWTLEVDPVKFTMAQLPEEADDNAIGSGINFGRIRLVSIRVWLSEGSGGTRGFSTEFPNAQLTRLIDPLALSNPDSLQTMIDSPGGMERLFERLMELDAAGGSP